MVSASFVRVLASFGLVSNVLATVFMTSPTAQTTCTGGQQCTIAWNDDGHPPSLAQFGNATVGIWIGSVTSQTQLQPIQASVNVSTTAAIQFTVDPKAGPNGNFYFVRFTSASTQDPSNPQFPAQSFSAKFSLSGMSGTLTPAEQAQISGASSNPIPSPSAPATAASASGKPTASSSSPATKSSTASAAGAVKTNAAMSLNVRESALGLLVSAALFAIAF